MVGGCCFGRVYTLFLITARLFLKWIKPGNITHTHSLTHPQSHSGAERLKENLFTERGCEPEAFAPAK